MQIAKTLYSNGIQAYLTVKNRFYRLETVYEI